MRNRSSGEIAHGKKLAAADTERVWGWATAAGKERAFRRAQLIAQGAELSPGKKVLEVGCGAGLFTELFSQFNADIVACDISDELLQKARNRGLDPERVRFICAQFEECGIEGPFDAIIGSSVLHHLEIVPALRKIRELLKPGGALSFAEPNMLNPQVFIERKFRKFFPYVSPDETAFTLRSIRNLLFDTGFSDVTIVSFDWLHPSTPKPFIPFVQKLSYSLEKTPFLRSFSGSLHIAAKRSS